jgi:hypothetical protein
MNYHYLYKLSLLILIATLTSCVISSYNEPCSLSGKVSDSTGKGIVNVIIHSKSSSSEDSIKTSSDGNYKINFSGGGVINLVFSKTGYTGKSESLVLLGGEKKVLNENLNTLSEDAYFNVGLRDKTVLNTGEIFSVGIHTNVLYEYESLAPWITCIKSGSELSIKCDSNETLEERSAIVILKAEYNHNDTIKIKQLAGPILRVIDCIGKNNTSFPQTKPFVTFSREITVLSATASGQNIAYELSSDNKTVYFNDIKLGAFSTMQIQLKVMASDNTQLEFTIPTLKLFINSKLASPDNGQFIYFTNDNKYVWILTYNGSSCSLRQFSTTDFAELKQISADGTTLLSYNPYNNSLYLISQVPFEDRYISEIKIYDAATGEYKNKLTIDCNGDLVAAMEFADNGYGLMILGNKLFYIDSSNKHNWSIFSTSTSLYDRSHGTLIPKQIHMCNNNKTFFLYGGDSGSNYYAYTVDRDTKVLTSIINNSNYYTKTVTSNSNACALYFSEYINKIIYQNVLTKSTKSIDLSSTNIYNLAILSSDKLLPYIFTSNFSLISADDNSIRNFTHQGTYYYIKSSNDGKLLLVNTNSTVYLFRSDTFTKFYDNIK